MYKHTYAQEPFYPLSCTVEIVQIPVQDNIETLLRYFQYTANVLHIKQRAKENRRESYLKRLTKHFKKTHEEYRGGVI